MSSEKTQTQVQIQLLSLQCLPPMTVRVEQQYQIELFFSSSRAVSKCFRFHENKIDFTKHGAHHILKIKNILGDALEFWLVLVSGLTKIIGVGTTDVHSDESERVIQFKLEKELFAKLTVSFNKTSRSIEKKVYIQPDEDLLKKVVDPSEELKKKQDQQNRKDKELQEQEELARLQKKKPAITITTYNKKDEPFI